MDIIYTPQEKAYIKHLTQHRKHVREAALHLHVPSIQIAQHDASKLTNIELPAFAKKFAGIINDKELDKAWWHHVQHNEHHPEHWVTPGDVGKPNTPIEIPENYIREMISDWMADNKDDTGKWDMSEWLKKNWHKKLLEETTREKTKHILINELEYSNKLFT
jgi:hypothetical protein